MDQGATVKQPSNTVLLATAVACAAAILWAYSDNAPCQGMAEAVEQAPPAATPAEPSLTYEPVFSAPALIPTSPEGQSADVQLFADAEFSDEAYLPNASPLRLPALQAPTPAAAPAEETIAQEPVEEESPAAPETEDYWAYEPYYEPSGNGPPSHVGPVEPEELWTEEESVLVTQSEPFAYLDQDAGYVAGLPDEELLTYTPIASEINQRVTQEVRAAFSLGRHGASHAARRRFLQVMEQIAAAKDVAAGTDQHSKSLDIGQTALREARDFLRGGAVSKELSVAEVAASHRTPMLHDQARALQTLPHQAAALYYRYAEQKLAAAVRGEQAGSMALYGLGKTHAQLAQIEGSAIDRQKTLVMHHAALLAHSGNFLAANELGVGLAQVGRYHKAAVALEQSIANGGGSTVYRNLAFVQHKLGSPQLAMATTQQADRLAHNERAAGQFSRDRGVQWVSPDRLARGAPRQNQPRGANTTAAVQARPPASGINRVTRFAKRIVQGQPRAAQPAPYTGPAPQQRTNRTAMPARSQTTIR